MHLTNSFLYTVCDRMRAYVDEPDLDAKYNDTYLCRHIIGPAMVDILSRLNNTIGSPLICSFDITLTASNTAYYLPPCVQQVLRVITTDTNGSPILDAIPRDIFHRNGPGWRLEGTPGALSFTTPSAPVGADQVITVWYIHNGDVRPHYGDGTLTLASTVPTITLDLLPTIGDLDRRPNAYVGCVLRIIPTTPQPIEERHIISHTYSGGVWTITLDRPLTYTSNGTVAYEIAPAGSESLYEAIAVWGAMKIGTALRLSEVHQRSLRTQYLAALKTIGDNLTDIQGRMPKHYAKDTIDNTAARNWISMR